VTPVEHNDAQFEKNKQWMEMYKKTGLAKLPQIKQYLEDTVLETGEKFLIFGHHRAVLDGIEETVKKNKIGYIRIDGQTQPKKRDDYVRKFQEDKQCKCAILSILAAGTGYTMTASSTVIFAELHFTPGILLQAEDRVHRIGQKASSVSIKYLIGRGTLDDTQLWPLLEKKVDVVGEAIDGELEKSADWQGGHSEFEKTVQDYDMSEDEGGDHEDAMITENNEEDFSDMNDDFQEGHSRSSVGNTEEGEEEYFFEDEEPQPKPKAKKNRDEVIVTNNQQKQTTAVSAASRLDAIRKKREERTKPKVTSANLMQSFLFNSGSTEMPFNVLHKTKEFQYCKQLVTTPSDKKLEPKQLTLSDSRIRSDIPTTEKKRNQNVLSDDDEDVIEECNFSSSDEDAEENPKTPTPAITRTPVKRLEAPVSTLTTSTPETASPTSKPTSKAPTTTVPPTVKTPTKRTTETKPMTPQKKIITKSESVAPVKTLLDESKFMFQPNPSPQRPTQSPSKRPLTVSQPRIPTTQAVDDMFSPNYNRKRKSDVQVKPSQEYKRQRLFKNEEQEDILLDETASSDSLLNDDDL
jgi:cell wall-associated NlpC family hydrolase